MKKKEVYGLQENRDKVTNLRPEPVTAIDAPNQWTDFIENLTPHSSVDEPAQRLFCRIDAELAYTLDACEGLNARRNDVINAIIRTFINSHLEMFKQLRKPSLFN